VVGRNDKRLLIWLLATAVLAAGLLFASVRMGDAAEDPVIDTGATVEPAQCAPCHLSLGSVDVPGLIFRHGNHLLVSCDGCHSRMPHKDGAVDKVPMETCFACHGIQHGPQGELATSECRSCHTPSFELRPRDHGDTWPAKPHADAALSRGTNTCMMCHNGARDCDGCHEREAPDIGKMPESYHTIVNPLPKGPSIKIYPKGEVSMSQCVYCHPDLDAITPGRLIFAHADHLMRNYSCEACHAEFPHNEKGAQTPDMLSCYRCHGLQHASQGGVATEDCDRCHPPGFDLKPADHTTAFARKTHPQQAKKRPEYCSMCHKTEFCIDCHNGKGKGPNAPTKLVIPADHRDAKWRSDHGKDYLDSKGLCGVCHTGPSCQRCHRTVVPHSPDFIANHTPPKGVPKEDCYICHKDRTECQQCHHREVQTAELTAENCTPCHDEMKRKPATSIKDKAFAEHAVHFDVAESKGKPYRCYQCHVDFGTSQAARKIELQQGHDLRLCYDCHGALDPFNRKIAPFKGAALCVRCHRDVGV
jgi:hypothetical protein